MLLGKGILECRLHLIYFLLVGNTAPGVSTTLGRSKPKSETPTKRDKRVSFMPEEATVTKFEYSSDPGQEETSKYDDNDNNITQENLDRLNAKEDPNVSNLKQIAKSVPNMNTLDISI